jgi:N-hydroxyarylamine O-acetyltransferase
LHAPNEVIDNKGTLLSVDLDRYLKRIGYDGPREPTERTLAALQRAHILNVPFDALDCLLGNRVTVEPEDAYRKVVDAGRGGYCFELNGLFAWALEEIGFDVKRLAARPLIPVDPGVAEPFAHLALLVELDRRWLVDVGFGYPFAHEPLDLDVRGEQLRDGRRFRISEDGDDLLVEELGAEEVRAYRFRLEPVEQDEFAPRCRIYSTDPDSVFVRHGPVVRVFDDGWVKVTRTGVAGVRGGRRIDREITDEADWRAALLEHAGLRLEGSYVTSERNSSRTSR